MLIIVDLFRSIFTSSNSLAVGPICSADTIRLSQWNLQFSRRAFVSPGTEAGDHPEAANRRMTTYQTIKGSSTLIPFRFEWLAQRRINLSWSCLKCIFHKRHQKMSLKGFSAEPGNESGWHPESAKILTGRHECPKMRGAMDFCGLSQSARTRNLSQKGPENE